MAVDLTPFGFTPTESLVYTTLLKLGPATGYEVARGARLARANAYQALEGLVHGGGAARAGDRPRRYRAADPATLLARLAARQGEALDRLGHSLERVALPADPVTRELNGVRATANVITQLVARAERDVAGVVAAVLWAPTVPAWRRAATRARLAVRIAGEAQGTEGLAVGHVEDDTPTLLVIDGAHMLSAETPAGGGEMVGLWSAHPLLVGVARRALETAT